MRSHEHYEELCALAATGQVPESEREGLQAHLADCPGCRSLVQEFAELGGRLVARAGETQPRSAVPAGMTERFAALARSEGIAISRNFVPEERSFFWRPTSVAAVALTTTLVLAAILGLAKLERLRLPGGVPASSAQAAIASGATSVSGVSAQASETQIAQLRREVTEARAQSDSLEARIQASREAVSSAHREVETLQAKLRQLEQENASLRTGDWQRAAEIAKLEQDIDALKSAKTASDVALLAEENELRTLRQSLAEREAALRQQQHLVDVGNQVRDLIVARNFHVFDVYDWDEDGNKQRAFGRIFYTEGKSLIFYAYDLADPRKIDRQVSFYAWGERLGGNSPVKRLGIFHSEDVNEGRWVLTFDDPRVLAQINSVFVTVEDERKAVTHPRGKRMLSAFLGNTANHP